MFKLILTGAALVLLGSSLGCSSEGDSGTTGKIIVLGTRVDVGQDLSEPTTNALGWDVTLTRAYLSVGPLYYYQGDPVLSQRRELSGGWRGRLAWMGDLLIPPAYAHPGHYIPGAAMGQMLTPTTLDLLEGSVDLADGEGVTGPTNSAEFTWQSPPEGDLADALEDHVILTEGVATKGSTTVEFIATADESEVHDGDDQAKVSGCSFGSEPGEVGVDMDGDGTVTLTVVPSVWFDQVDFSYVASGTEGAPEPNSDGVVDLRGTLAFQGFLRGVKKGTAYLFSYSH